MRTSKRTLSLSRMMMINGHEKPPSLSMGGLLYSQRRPASSASRAASRAARAASRAARAASRAAQQSRPAPRSANPAQAPATQRRKNPQRGKGLKASAQRAHGGAGAGRGCRGCAGAVGAGGALVVSAPTLSAKGRGLASMRLGGGGAVAPPTAKRRRR